MKTTERNPANARRVRRIQSVLLAQYNEANAKRLTWDEQHDGVIDLLADIRHYCDKAGLAFGELDRIAHNHYLEEMIQTHRIVKTEVQS